MSDQWLDLFADKLQNQEKQNHTDERIPVSQFIEGDYLNNSHIFVREKQIKCDELLFGHKDMILSKSLRKYARIFLNDALHPENIMFIDTETTGLSRSQGTFVFLLGLGRIRGDHFVIRQYFIEEMADEDVLYQELVLELKNVELFVSYNGKSFDIPLLQSRMILQKYDMNLRQIPHFDLLPVARRLWKSKVENFSLGRMEYHLFEKIRSDEFDVPGYIIPSLYAEYQANGNPEKLISVFYHNEDDISSLLSIYAIVVHAFNHDEDTFKAQQFNLLEIGRLYEQIGEDERALIYYQKSNEEDSSVSLLYLARLYKRMKREKDAENCWLRILNEEGYIELSKLYEKQKKYHLSLHYAQKAKQFLVECGLLSQQKEEKIQQRIERIERKIYNSSDKSI